MRSVIIMEVSFFSDQNSPKNFSQKCKKIPLPTLTFSSDIMPPQSQIDSMHSMLSILWQCRSLSNFFTRPITTIGLYIYYCLFQDHFFAFKQVMMARVRYLSINWSYATKWQIARGQYSILLHLCALTAMQKEYGHICL